MKYKTLLICGLLLFVAAFLYLGHINSQRQLIGEGYKDFPANQADPILIGEGYREFPGD